MLTLLFYGVTGVVFVVLCVVGYFFVTNKKVKRRVKSRFDDLGNKIADATGDITDDRREAINERVESNADLEKRLTNVLVEIDTAKDGAEEAIANAQKFGELAAEAVSFDNDEAAMNFLGQQEDAEALSKTLLGTVEALDSTFRDLKRQLDNSREDVASAKRQTASFEARNTALDLRKKMQETKNAFGGQGSLDFSDSDDELKRKERELDAADKMSGTESQNAVQDFEKQKAQRARQDKLAALKGKMNA